MTNAEIADVFERIAELLELKGENPFKIRAYRRGAETIAHLSASVAERWRAGTLAEVPGLGEALVGKTGELVETGLLGYLERLEAEFPPGLPELLAIPGIGPKTVARLRKELKVASLDDLEAAARAGQLAALPRFGPHTEENILKAVASYRQRQQSRRTNLGVALPFAQTLVELLAETPGLRRIECAGSVRRGCETVGNLNLLAASDQPALLLDRFLKLGQVREVVERSDERAVATVLNGLPVELRVAPLASFGAWWLALTGSVGHLEQLLGRAEARGLSAAEAGLILPGVARAEPPAIADEAEIYRRLGLPWIAPELREGDGEVEAAAAGRLPELVTLGDIRGDLHAHTEWSDGATDIASMAAAARERGYRYLVISDHSGGLGVANGLTPERLREQRAAIAALNESFDDGFRLLAGSEVDIRADGTLDFPDEVLAELDLVVASIHSAMNQPLAKMTERVIRAIQNPNVDVIGHLTTRLLGSREPVELDLEQVFRTAAETGTALEINSSPSRLDLRDQHVRQARARGVRFAIDSDAHAPPGLDVLPYGVTIARRGWCGAGEIVNTRDLDGLRAFTERRG